MIDLEYPIDLPSQAFVDTAQRALVCGALAAALAVAALFGDVAWAVPLMAPLLVLALVVTCPAYSAYKDNNNKLKFLSRPVAQVVIE